MNQRDAIIDVAISQLGYTEGPNNDTKYGDWYGLPNEPWCAMFISWCAWMAGIPTSIIPKYASNTGGFEVMTEMGITTTEKITPKKGDIIFFDWDLSGDKDHCGLVEYVENGRVHTIEGNHDDNIFPHFIQERRTKTVCSLCKTRLAELDMNQQSWSISIKKSAFFSTQITL